MNTPVNFELAKLLKEKGFNEEVRDYYEEKDGTFYHSQYFRDNVSINEKHNGFVTAPTIAEVVMWLYEKYGVWIYPLPIDDNMKLWQSRIIKGEPFNKLSNTLKIISHGEISYRSMYSPTEAYEAAILYTLKNLIP